MPRQQSTYRETSIGKRSVSAPFTIAGNGTRQNEIGGASDYDALQCFSTFSFIALQVLFTGALPLEQIGHKVVE